MSLIRLAAPLRPCVGGQTTVPVEAADIASLPGVIAERYPDLAARVLRDGRFGAFVNVFVDGEDVRYLTPDTTLASAKVIEILPAMSGGA